MFDGIQPAIRTAIMSILSALYESGVVEEVDMADVMRLFGVDPPKDVTTRFSFHDEDWVKAYIDFRESNTLILTGAEDEVEEAIADADLSSNRKLH